MAYYCTRVTITTNFDDFFPTKHHDVQLYESWKRYGGAQTLSIMVQVQNDDIFNPTTLRKIQNVQREVDTIPGVDHNEVLSLASYRITYAEVNDAIVLALKTTGVAVFNTFLVMIGGIFPWIFSPLLFHNEISTLLIFLMGTNMIAGCIILPCYLSWARPKFVFGGRSMMRERELKAAVS